MASRAQLSALAQSSLPLTRTGPDVQSSLPPTRTGPGVRRVGCIGGPQPAPESESWCPLGPGLPPLLLGQPHRLLLPASWKTGPWAPCSASCGGGSQSRSVYCVSSSGAGVQEAAEEAECAGLPGKPPATQACNLQRCAAWSAGPWGEVSPSRVAWGRDQELGRGPGAAAGAGRLVLC